MIYNIEDAYVEHDFVLVRRVDTRKTPGGIHLPFHSDKQESNIAKVVAVGPGIPGKPETVPRCAPGEYWVVARYIGTIITINGRDHVLVKWYDMQVRLTFSEAALSLLDDCLEAPTQHE